MEIKLSIAQHSADLCSGENAIQLSSLTKDNVLFKRMKFLENVKHNGRRTHEDIITVLQYMTPFIKQED